MTSPASGSHITSVGWPIVARAGDDIVCSEPTAALFFRLDALGLLDGPDVRLVADRTVEVDALPLVPPRGGAVRTDFQPVNVAVGHHVPCHVKALGRGCTGPVLLSLIPGLHANKMDVSCSGHGRGLWVEREQPADYPSQPAGRCSTSFRRPRHIYGSSECSACRLQMQEGTANGRCTRSNIWPWPTG